MVVFERGVFGFINPLQTKRRLLYLKTQFGYKNQSVYAVSGTSRRLFSDKYKTLYLKTQFLPRSKHFSSVIKTNQFML